MKRLPFVQLAYRNLWRNRRRTRLTMLAMSAATALLIFTLAMYDGILWDLVTNATETVYGHVMLASPEYLDHPTLTDTLPGGPLIGEEVAARLGIRGSCGRLSSFGLLSCSGGTDADRTHPAELLGVDPSEEKRFSQLPAGVIEGRFLETSDSTDLILGKGLARRLEAKIGGEVVFMGQGADGSLAAEIFRLVGVIDTHDTARDASLALVGRATLQRLLALDGRVHLRILFLKNPLEAEATAAHLRTALPTVGVRPWQVSLPQIAHLFRLWGGMQAITTVIFYFAVLLIGFSTMYMAFRERLREFAILGAVGLTKRRLAVLILLEGLLLSSFSALLGGAVGVAASFLFQRFPLDLSRFMTDIAYAGASLQPRVYCVPNLMNVLMPMVVMAVIGLGVSLLPAWRLLRLRPVEALREA